MLPVLIESHASTQANVSASTSCNHLFQHTCTVAMTISKRTNVYCQLLCCPLRQPGNLQDIHDILFYCASRYGTDPCGGWVLLQFYLSIFTFRYRNVV